MDAARVHPVATGVRATTPRTPGPERVPPSEPGKDVSVADLHATLPFIPDDLIAHRFALDVKVAEVSTAGKEDDDVAKRVGQVLEKHWRSARRKQERAWAVAGAVPVELHDSVKRFATPDANRLRKLEVLLGTWYQEGVLTPRLADRLARCVRVTSVSLYHDEAATREQLEQCPNDTPALVTVDISGDPLLDEIGYDGPRHVKVRFVVYEAHLRSERAKREFLDRGVRSIQFSRIVDYDYALFFPAVPWPNFSLPLPQKGFTVEFPTDSDAMAPQIDGLKEHNRAVAKLTDLFWGCFNELYSGGGKASTYVGMGAGTERISGKAFSQLSKVDVGEEEARDAIRSVCRPTAFHFTFRRAVVAEDGARDANAVLKAIQRGIHEAALEIEDDVLPTAWGKPKGREQDVAWPMRAVLPASASARSDGAAGGGDDGADAELVVERLMSPHDHLACVTFTGELLGDPTSNIVADRVLGRTRSMSHPEDRADSPSEPESKQCLVVVDLRNWEDKGELVAQNIDVTNEWGILGTINAVEEMASAAVRHHEKNDGLLERLSDLAFGLRALQRSHIKQQLRAVGLSVLEAERRVVETGALRLLAAQLQFAGRNKPDETETAAKTQRVMFISASLGVLEDRTERQGWRRRIAPDDASREFIGGFTPEQFDHDGPTDTFWRATRDDPYPYNPYFRAARPDLDPMALLSPAERKYLVRRFITDEPSDHRLANGMIDPSEGGADMDPRELITEGVLESIETLAPSPLVGRDLDDFVDRVVFPWRKFGLWKCICTGTLFRANVDEVCYYYGPEIASYFQYLEFYVAMLFVPALLGLVMDVCGSMQAITRAVPAFAHAHALNGLINVLWGAFFCWRWRGAVARMMTRWDNGVLEAGAELSGAGAGERGKLGNVRPEFATSFRKSYDKGTKEQRKAALSTIRKALRAEAYNNTNFTDRDLENDLEQFNEACLIAPHIALSRRLIAVSTSVVFVLLAVAATTISLMLQQFLSQSASEENQSNQLLSYLISGLSQGIFVPLLNSFHHTVALETTNWQSLRSDREHGRSLFFKWFAFSFFNYFNSIAYIAFVIRSRVHLRTQVALLVIAQCTYGNLKEFIEPYVQRSVRVFVSSKQMKHSKSRQTRNVFLEVKQEDGGTLARTCKASDDQQFRSQEFGIYDELIEMVLQFAMLVIFAVAFPGGAVLAWVSAIAEIRIDMYKLARLLKMPTPRMFVGLDVSYSALCLMVLVAVLLYCAILLVVEHPEETSDNGVAETAPHAAGKTEAEVLLDDLTPASRIAHVIVFEHILLVIVALVLSIDRVVPRDVFDERYRQSYFEKREAAFYAEDEERADEARSAARSFNSFGGSPGVGDRHRLPEGTLKRTSSSYVNRSG